MYMYPSDLNGWALQLIEHVFKTASVTPSASGLPHDWIMRGTGGSDPPPLENYKAIGFLTNIGPDPLGNHKTTKPAFNVGHHRHTSETPFTWRFACGPMMACLYIFFLYPLSFHQLKKNVVKVELPLTFWIRACAVF